MGLRFLFDACANGQQLKCLTVIDEFTRECLAIDVAGSIRSGRVIDALSRPVSVHGAPKHLRSDNGPEFVSQAVLRWLTQSNIDTACIDPGKPWQNGSNESFNGKFRDEWLSMQWFNNRIDAKILIEEFRRQYNEVRPHSSLGQLTPAEFNRPYQLQTRKELSTKYRVVRRKPAGQTRPVGIANTSRCANSLVRGPCSASGPTITGSSHASSLPAIAVVLSTPTEN